MKKLFAFSLLFVVLVFNAQTANRFFYELNYKPKKGIDSLQKTGMVLDITDKKSIYRDFLDVSQDSIIKDAVEKMQKSGVFQDPSKLRKEPKFSHRVWKEYPSMRTQYIDFILNGDRPMYISYTEDIKFNWKIEKEKQKVGEYEAQKATTEFGGRKWTAWFSEALPFPDGPYKFSGLPGLIVKIEDAEKNYSWELKGNKKIEKYNELTYMENLMTNGSLIKPTDVPKEKFEKTFTEYKKDPFGSMRDKLAQIDKNMKFPGSDKTVGEFIAEQEKKLKDFYNSIDNSIEVLEKK